MSNEIIILIGLVVGGPFIIGIAGLFFVAMITKLKTGSYYLKRKDD